MYLWPPQTSALVPTAFEQGHCYEPYVKYGNFTTSDPRYPVGTTVEFSCHPGYTLEQGSTIIECVDPSDPQWNETEPACRGGHRRWGDVGGGAEGLELGLGTMAGGASMPRCMGVGPLWDPEAVVGARSGVPRGSWGVLDPGCYGGCHGGGSPWWVLWCVPAAVCSGELMDTAGVVLSPNWPEAYGKGQDCIWGLHVEEDKRVMLDIRV